MSRLIEIDYNTLVKNTSLLTEEIANAFGEDGLGILVVSNVPNVTKLRSRLLQAAFQFSRLPEDVKCKYVHKNHQIGWSCGVEKLADGKNDTRKGSYYARLGSDFPTSDIIADLYPENIWLVYYVFLFI